MCCLCLYNTKRIGPLALVNLKTNLYCLLLSGFSLKNIRENWKPVMLVDLLSRLSFRDGTLDLSKWWGGGGEEVRSGEE